MKKWYVVEGLVHAGSPEQARRARRWERKSVRRSFRSLCDCGSFVHECLADWDTSEPTPAKFYEGNHLSRCKECDDGWLIPEEIPDEMLWAQVLDILHLNPFEEYTGVCRPRRVQELIRKASAQRQAELLHRAIGGDALDIQSALAKPSQSGLRR